MEGMEEMLISDVINVKTNDRDINIFLYLCSRFYVGGEVVKVLGFNLFGKGADIFGIESSRAVKAIKMKSLSSSYYGV